jgi:hypothetical protein
LTSFWKIKELKARYILALMKRFIKCFGIVYRNVCVMQCNKPSVYSRGCGVYAKIVPARLIVIMVHLDLECAWPPQKQSFNFVDVQFRLANQLFYGIMRRRDGCFYINHSSPTVIYIKTDQIECSFCILSRIMWMPLDVPTKILNG